MTGLQSVLFVDDEPHLLSGLKRSLRPLRSEFKFEFASDGMQALDLLNQSKFDLVISDMRMPGMDGGELLARVSESFPDTVRIILSGQASAESLIRALPSTHQYLPKPFRPESLKELMHKLKSLRSIIPNAIMRSAISKVTRLPCRRELLEQFVSLLKNNDYSARLWQVAQGDIGISAQMMHLVVSTSRRERFNYNSLPEAFATLGHEILEKLMWEELFYPVDSKFNGIDLIQLSHRGIRRAHAFAEIAKTRTPLAITEAYWAGIFYELGSIIKPPSGVDFKAANVINEKSKRKSGAYLLALWGFPESIYRGILETPWRDDGKD